MATTQNEIMTRIILRNDIKANWDASSLVLLKGEPALMLGADGVATIYVGDGTKTLSQLTPSTRTPAEITQEIKDLIDSEGVTSVSLTSGTNNGTLKLTVDGVSVDNIAVTGLGSAAFTDADAYATAEQGEKADAAMPKAGGTFTGTVILAGDPTTEMGAATKKYVDDNMSSIRALDWKGTLGTGGKVTALPTSGVKKGEVYIAVSAGTVAAAASYSGSAVDYKVGDMILAENDSASGAPAKWTVIPSGDETETTIRMSTETSNLSDTKQTGDVVLGEAAGKQVATAIADADTSVKLPTAAAVATFVEGKGYTTTDENVKSTPTSSEKVYLVGSTAATEKTAGLKKTTGAYIDTDGSVHATAGFVGDVTGTADKADALTEGITVSMVGGAVGTSTAVNAGETAQISVTSVNTDYLVNGVKELVLNGGNAGITG